MAFSERITLPYVYERELPDFQKGDDIKFPDTLAAALLEKYAKPGDKILDPFCGLGTTFFACETMNLSPYGVEADRQRYEWVRERIRSKDGLVHGDSARIASFGFPEMDFSLTSPPYMPRHHRWNPLYDGDERFDGYERYLSRMREIYQEICKLMKQGAYIVVQADNLVHEGFSPLVWDLGRALSDVMTLDGEILVTWSENRENGNAFTQCLVFRNAGPSA